MMLKTNPMRAGLAAGRPQIGTWLNLVRNPAVLTLLKAAGLDYVRVDMEHSSPSVETIANMAVLARALDFPLVVRPPTGNREWVTRLLDMGVWGLHVPQVDNPDIAHTVVQAARYAPVGDRGQAASGPHNDFDSTTDVIESNAHMNDQVHITVMLESAEAFGHIDEIVGMPGIDAVTLGPNDLARELRVLATPDETRVIDEYRMKLIAVAQKHGKDAAMLVRTIEEGERWLHQGARIIAYSSDVAILKDGFAAAVRRLRSE